MPSKCIRKNTYSCASCQAVYSFFLFFSLKSFFFSFYINRLCVWHGWWIYTKPLSCYCILSDYLIHTQQIRESSHSIELPGTDCLGWKKKGFKKLQVRCVSVCMCELNGGGHSVKRMVNRSICNHLDLGSRTYFASAGSIKRWHTHTNYLVTHHGFILNELPHTHLFRWFFLDWAQHGFFLPMKKKKKILRKHRVSRPMPIK